MNSKGEAIDIPIFIQLKNKLGSIELYFFSFIYNGYRDCILKIYYVGNCGWEALSFKARLVNRSFRVTS